MFFGKKSRNVIRIQTSASCDADGSVGGLRRSRVLLGLAVEQGAAGGRKEEGVAGAGEVGVPRI